MEEIHIIVRGKVQGVGFRANVKRIAELVGVHGRVSNLSDGSVEIYAQGSSEKLNALLEQVKERYDSYIESIDLKKQTSTSVYTNFKITDF
ncbi:MAG: acylphosphatase [Chlamydiae bacterium]|nr:acylphosphatase [Chlamydiota bacterium]